ncbi:MAG: radical SAM protein [Deltaproteobacteria bacterium]|nr:radical SAM protein [Deltaproteobacteria bacterium]
MNYKTPHNKLQKPPVHVGWIITTKCNINCMHCYSSKFGEEELEDEKKFLLVKELSEAGVKKVDLTGGEIFILPNILDLIGYISSLGIELTIFTNGTLLTAGVVELLSNYQPNIVLSLDGAKKETHETLRGKNSWEKVMNAARLLKERGIFFSTLTAINGYNYTEVEEQILLAKEIGAKKVSFILTMPVGRASDIMILTHNQIVEVLKRINAAANNTQFPVTLCCMPFADLWVDSEYVTIEHCRTDEPEIIDIDPLGNLLLCDVSEFCYSNILKTGFLSALKKQEEDTLYLSIFNPELEEPCLKCENSEKCKGGCYSRAEAYGNILSPDPLCPKVGKFRVL